MIIFTAPIRAKDTARSPEEIVSGLHTVYHFAFEPDGGTRLVYRALRDLFSSEFQAGCAEPADVGGELKGLALALAVSAHIRNADADMPDYIAAYPELASETRSGKAVGCRALMKRFFGDHGRSKPAQVVALLN